MNKKVTNNRGIPFRIEAIANVSIVYDERLEPFEKMIQNALNGDYTEIIFDSVKQFVFANGCSSSDECISIITELRDKGVNLHFLDYSLNSRNIEEDMKISSLIGDAVYELYLKKQGKKI